MEVLFDYRQDKVRLDEDMEELLEKVIETVLKQEKMPLDYEVSVSFVTNDEIRELNRDFRGKDSETDVLSFPFEDDFDLGVKLLGDIVISVEKAASQAEDFGHDLKRELAYLTAHSTLHLLGYDHMSEEEMEIMRSKEKSVMKTLGIFK